MQAADSIFSMIDRKSLIDPESEEGDRTPLEKGELRLEQVTFAYPTRPDVIVFKGRVEGETMRFAFFASMSAELFACTCLFAVRYHPIRVLVKQQRS